MTTYTTAKGTKIELIAAENGAVVVNANGKFVGVIDDLVDHPAHGKVITLKGQQSVVTMGEYVNLVASVMTAAKDAAEQIKKQSDAYWAAWELTPEGQLAVGMARIERQERE